MTVDQWMEFQAVPRRFVRHLGCVILGDDLDREFQEHLDDVYGSFWIEGEEVWASRALRDLNPLTYSRSFGEWLRHHNLHPFGSTIEDTFICEDEMRLAIDEWSELGPEEQVEWADPPDKV